MTALPFDTRGTDGEALPYLLRRYTRHRLSGLVVGSVPFVGTLFTDSVSDRGGER